MNFYKRLFMICFLVLITFTVTSCKRNENKCELELFVEEYYKYHPEPYTLETGFYKIQTYETSYTEDEDYTIVEQNYIGTICFTEKEFNGYLSNFTYEFSKLDIKDNCIVNSISKNVYLYNNSYYEVLTGNDNIKKTYGCENVGDQNIKFRAHTSVKSFTRYFFNPDMLLYMLEYKALIKAVIIENLEVKMVFEKPISEDETLEHTFTYYYDNKYNLLKVVRTSIYHIFDGDNDKREYFFTSTLEKIDNYNSSAIDYEYEFEKNFQPQDLYFMF